MLEQVVILSLVTWRVCSLLHTEALFDWLRKRLGIIQNDSMDTHTWGYPSNIIGDFFECFWCMSLWVSLLISVSVCGILRVSIIHYPLTWLGSATGAIMVERWVGRSKARW